MTLTHPQTYHSLRRGKLWRFMDQNEYLENDSGNNVPEFNMDYKAPFFGKEMMDALKKARSASQVVQSPSSIDLPKLQAKSMQKFNSAQNSRYGFQFLWNPDTFNVSVDVNMNVTPNTADMFSTVVKAFPSMQSLSFTIVLDRTNDFACFRALSTNGRYDKSKLNQYQKFYPNQFGSNKEEFSYQFENLLRLGTLADLEYLFRTINGNLEFETVLGRRTADIGFLTPSQVALQLGPSADSITYTGWINNLNVQHISFTEEMIPLRTLVSVTMPTFTNQKDGSEG